MAPRPERSTFERRGRPTVAALALALACGSSVSSCGSEPAEQHVFLIGIDTLRADFLEPGSPAVTPHLDALRAESRVFRAAHATAPWTQPSLASVLTGRWPWQHGVTRLLDPLPPRELTLAEVFRASGWSTSGVMANFVARGRTSYGQGFERWDESLATGHEDTTSEAVVDRALAQVTGGNNQLHFLYFFDPHWLYQPSEAHAELAMTRYHELGTLRAELDGVTADERAELVQLYTDDVERVDRALGRLRSELEARGIWEDAVIVLFADHGEYLGEATWSGAPWVGHTVDLSATLMRVPLWVRAPGVAPGVVDDPVSLVDLGATVLDLAGIEERLGEGRSLLSEPLRDHLYLHVDFEPALVRADSQRKRTLMWGVVDRATRRKWVVDHLALAGPAGLLFDGGAKGEQPRAFDAPPTDLATLRGLVPEPLDGHRGEEPVPTTQDQ